MLQAKLRRNGLRQRGRLIHSHTASTFATEIRMSQRRYCRIPYIPNTAGGQRARTVRRVQTITRRIHKRSMRVARLHGATGTQHSAVRWSCARDIRRHWLVMSTAEIEVLCRKGALRAIETGARLRRERVLLGDVLLGAVVAEQIQQRGVRHGRIVTQHVRLDRIIGAFA